MDNIVYSRNIFITKWQLNYDWIKGVGEKLHLLENYGVWLVTHWVISDKLLENDAPERRKWGIYHEMLCIHL